MKLAKPVPGVSLAALLLAASLCLGLASCIKPPSQDEVKAMMQVVDVTTKWVSKAYQPWPPKLILVPSISFRIKNVSARPLTYVDFNAIFRFKGESENLGDSFYAGIRGTPVEPGQLSDLVTLKSNFGQEGRSLASFKDNPQWRTVTVKLFAMTHGSRPALLGEYDVSREIDFKEPAPVLPQNAGEKKEPQE
jgi:hypothetical protein